MAAERANKPERDLNELVRELKPNEAAGEAIADLAGVSVEGARLSDTGRRGDDAIQAFQEAANLDAIPRLSHGDELVYSLEAQKARERAEKLLRPAAPILLSAGEVATGDGRIVETLEHPDSISAGASNRRMSAALDAGVLEPAIDAVMSAQAANSIEKMLCHQMAAVHYTAMRLFKLSADLLERLPLQRQLQPGEVARLTNAGARMSEVYQAGCLTLQKLKTGGRQQVLVQHQQVNVAPGGQALVAGRIGRGSRRGGRRQTA